MRARVSANDVALFTRRLADLTGGGMTLNRSFDVLIAQTGNRAFLPALRSMKREIESGKSFSQALAAHKPFFSPVYAGLIRAGESSGNLEPALEELARLLDNEIEARRKIRAACAYPLFLLILAAAVSIFLTVFVIPRFEFLFQDLGQRLPWPTRVLIGFSMLAQKQFLVLIVLAAGIVWLFVKNKSAWNSKIQSALLRAGWSRDLIQGAYLERWSQVMASLIKSGFTVAEALQLSRHAFGNRFYSDEVGAALRRVLEGRGLAESLGASPLFPPMVCELIGAGEESAQLDQTFRRISQTYHREMEMKMKLALSFLEPALILGMGAVVGFVALGMLLPIFEMSASFR